MKQGPETDKICIEKIIRYIEDIRDCFEHFGIDSYIDLENQRLARLAITQAITNIYETKKHIRQSALENLADFDKVKISAARNIASHDYDSVNFRIIYDICCKLTSKQVNEVLKNGYSELGQQNN